MLIKLFSLSRMINDPKPTQFIAWTELGTSFVVSIVEEFSRSVLGSHLEHNNVGFWGIRMWHEFIPPMGSSNSPTCGYGDYRLLKSSSLSWYHISVNHLWVWPQILLSIGEDEQDAIRETHGSHQSGVSHQSLTYKRKPGNKKSVIVYMRVREWYLHVFALSFNSTEALVTWHSKHSTFIFGKSVHSAVHCISSEKTYSWSDSSYAPSKQMVRWRPFFNFAVKNLLLVF